MRRFLEPKHVNADKAKGWSSRTTVQASRLAGGISLNIAMSTAWRVQEDGCSSTVRKCGVSKSVEIDNGIIS